MRIFVTGTDGYIGCQLASMLLERGHHVTGLDTGYYRDGWLYHDRAARFPACLNKDIRHITVRDIKGFDAIVHLAELSNDPLGQHNPAITHQINHAGSVNLAKMAIEAGITRFVYASSCSVYGVGDGDDFKTEESAVNPQTAYAKCKVLVEQDVSALARPEFSPTFLRNATAYGPSPRMRFDIVLNNLAGLAWTTREIRMTSDGTPWRPLVHVRDIVHAVICTLAADRQTVHNQVFNVGSTAENYRVRDIAQIVADAFPGCSLTVGTIDSDNRSYRVNFDKIHHKLPGFRCGWTAADGAKELRELFERINLTAEMFGFPAFTRLRELEHLTRTGQLDGELFWKA
jgi:nucleoside-diphosphate-sugar epimerase